MTEAIPVLKSFRETVAQTGPMMAWIFGPQASTIDWNSELPVFEGRDYECRVTRDRSDLRRVFQLRYEVFRREYASPASLFRIDIDQYDRFADHLVVFHKASGRPVGTYRLISEECPHGYYSEREFELGPFLSLPGRKLELGRACVHPEHRNGAVLRMLWRGLIEFAHERQFDLFFGCSSVLWPGKKPGAAALHAELVRRGAWAPIEGVRPTRRYAMPLGMREEWALAESGWIPPAQLRDDAVTPSLLPPLVASYLRSGARVLSAPAYDADFHCLDLLTAFSVRSSRGTE